MSEKRNQNHVHRYSSNFLSVLKGHLPPETFKKMKIKTIYQLWIFSYLPYMQKPNDNQKLIIISLFSLNNTKFETKSKFLYSKQSKKTFLVTSPGITVPTEGAITTGASSGTKNSNDVGPTGNISPEPILGTGCVNWFVLKWLLVTNILIVEVSLTAVARNFIRLSDNSRGGNTPIPLHLSVNSRPIWDLQSKLNLYS